MIFRLEPKITKKYLLERNSQETYLSTYLGVPVRKGLFRSVLRRDLNPTCSFFRNKKGEIIFKDFGSDMSGDFVKVVMLKYGLDYRQALKKIANDFGYIHTNEVREPIKISTEKFEEEHHKAVIQVEVKDWTKKELKWWNDFGVDKDMLHKYGVYSCQTVFLNGNIYVTSTADRPVFGYYRGKDSDGTELWRIYMPNHRKSEPKFLSNWTQRMLQGSKQLDKTGELLVITKAMKDCMVLRRFGINAIAPISECTCVSEAQLKQLQKRFKKIALFYDTDIAGLSNMRKFKRQLGLDCFWIPRRYKAKDISDFYKKYGEQETQKLINEAIERECGNYP